MTVTNNFKVATEELYSTFGKYPFKSTMAGCPCCVSDADRSTLHSKPLRDLQDDDISRYAFKAMTTWGDLEDYKYYLPRIFELTAKRELIVDVFLTFGKLEYGQWNTWPATEQKAIMDFLRTWWTYDINHASCFDLEIFIELHKYLNDLPFMLKQWKTGVDTPGFRNFVGFINYHYQELVSRKSTFKNLSIEDITLLINWLKNNADKLTSGFFEHENQDDEFAGNISSALYILERVG